MTEEQQKQEELTTFDHVYFSILELDPLNTFVHEQTCLRLGIDNEDPRFLEDEFDDFEDYWVLLTEILQHTLLKVAERNMRMDIAHLTVNEDLEQQREKEYLWWTE